MANKFNQPYITGVKIDNGKIADLFSKAINMDPFEIKQFSLYLYEIFNYFKSDFITFLWVKLCTKNIFFFYRTNNI